MKTTLSKCINWFDMRDEVGEIRVFLLCRIYNFFAVEAQPKRNQICIMVYFWINTGYYIFILQNSKFVTLIDFFL